MRYITENGITYRIRGPYTAKELRELYAKVNERYPMRFIDFLNRGKVYSRLERRTSCNSSQNR